MQTQSRKFVEHQQQTEHTEDDRGTADDQREVSLDPAERAGEPAECETGNEERQAETERVDRTGPMHGDQPNANAAPAMNGAASPKRPRCGWNRFS